MAQEWTDCFETGVDNAEGVATIRCLEPLFSNIVTGLITLAGVALFVMLIISGYNYLFAGGDMKKLEKAKGAMSGALIGLVVIVAAYLIIRLIEEFLGLGSGTLTIFRIFYQGP
jgi:hypothetical protein